MPPLHVVREKYLWPNFVVSVWLLIGLGVFDFVWNVAHWQIFTARPYKPSNAIAPLIMAGFETTLWFMLYRHRGDGTRIMAGTIGGMIFLQMVFVPVVWVGLYDIPLDWTWFLYLYATGMHLLVTVIGLEKRSSW